MLEGVSTTLPQIQRRIIELVPAEALLVGHSLESDLQALRLVHERVLDTALLFPHQKGPPFKPSLRFLAERFLGRDIQQGPAGHCSAEDARAALDLALLKIRNGPSFGEVWHRDRTPLFTMLTRPRHGSSAAAASAAASKCRCSLVDSARTLHRHATGGSSAITADGGDQDVVSKACREIRKKLEAPASPSACTMQLVWMQLKEYSTFLERRARELELSTLGVSGPPSDTASAQPPPEHVWAVSGAREAKLQELVARLTHVHDSLPPNTLMIICTGHGDTALMRRVQEAKWKANAKVAGAGEWTDEREQFFTALQERVRRGLVWVAVKQ